MTSATEPAAEETGALGPFDRAVAEFGGLSQQLVLLDDIALPELARRVTGFEEALRSHIGGAASDGAAAPISSEIDEDHRTFAESIEVLEWLLGIVRTDDHGGNRQALGQYGKVLAEALLDHRARETGSGRPAGRPGSRRSAGPRGNRK